MNETIILSRVPRHISFVEQTDFSLCIYQTDFKFETKELCNFILSTDSCHMYVFYMNYLRLIYCTFGFTNTLVLQLIVTFLAIMMIIFNLLLTYMITKYFFFPNFLTLRRTVPFSDFVYGYIYYGIFLDLPMYLNLIISCPYVAKHKTTFDFTKILGTIIVLFGVGIMQLCHVYYIVDGCRWWINMIIIITGYMYLILTVQMKISIYQNDDELADTERYLLYNRALFFLVMFLLLSVLMTLISYARGQRPSNISEDIEMTTFSMSRPSEYDLTMHSLQNKKTVYNKRTLELWHQSVSSFFCMKDENILFRYFAAPFFFIVACLVPVIDYERPLNGWRKAIIYTSFASFAFIFIPFKPFMSAFLGLFILSLLICMYVHLSTEAETPPKYLFMYALLGLGLSSTFLMYSTNEIEAITWQWIPFSFHSSPDMIAILLFNVSPLLTQYLIVSWLLKQQLPDVACGVVMGRTTIMIFTALPVLMLHQCPSPSFITHTAIGATSSFFTLTIFVYTLFGISICGYDFRPLIGICPLILLGVYYAFQLGSIFNLLHPLGTQHMPMVPQIVVNNWA